MKAFTLIEISIALLIMLVSGFIFVSYNFGNKDFFYLRDAIKRFAFALTTASDMSQRIVEKPAGNFYCGYGIYFPNSRSFETLAFSTSTPICEDIPRDAIAMQNFLNANLTNKTYVLENQDLVKSINIPILSLNVTLKPGINFLFSSTSNCISTYTTPLLLLYIYSYNDLFFIYQQAAGWQRLNVDDIYVCLKKGNENFKIRVNKLGQITLQQ